MEVSFLVAGADADAEAEAVFTRDGNRGGPACAQQGGESFPISAKPAESLLVSCSDNLFSLRQISVDGPQSRSRFRP